MSKFYITTSIPYVNGAPHVGHALEFCQADSLRRYHRDILKEKTLLLSGADENALKNVQAAEKLGITTAELCDLNSKKFRELAEKLNIKFDVFQRGSDQSLHWPGVIELWDRCLKAGDIYKKPYQGLYCVGCENFYKEEELTGGLCPYHLKKPELVAEENYFFRLSDPKFAKIEQLIESGDLKILPTERKNEVLAFIRGGLEDFSISRSNRRARNWGVPVPGDKEQRIYVWFDALAIYLTGLGFNSNEKKFNEWWPADLHIIGKDIIKFHCVYWIGMLVSAGLPLPRALMVHGFINSEGQKMSKTLGNVIDPFELLKKFGSEASRYFYLAKIPTLDDGDLTLKRFEDAYNSDLANGLGNLVSRIAKLAETSGFEGLGLKRENYLLKSIDRKVKELRLNQGLGLIWKSIREVDVYLNQKRPWENLPGSKADLDQLVTLIREIGQALVPFMPETAAVIQEQFKGPKIKAAAPIFPRL